MSRQQLAERFAASSNVPTKTLVLDTHPSESAGTRDYIQGLLDNTGDVHPTNDAFLFRVEAEGEVELWIDALEARFWSVHSWSRARDVKRYIKSRVEARRDLDFAWLPSAHLRGAWPEASGAGSMLSKFKGHRLLPEGVTARDMQVRVRGNDSQKLLDYIEENDAYRSAVAFDRIGFDAVKDEFGSAREAVDRLGRFAATGTSFELHQEIVRGVVQRYRRLVFLVESRALSISTLEHGGYAPLGSPIVLRFRPIPDMGVFLDGLFSAREPFRLWGIPEQAGDDAWVVEAVDLHVGQRIPMDVGTDWLRIYLPQGACGNTVVRLVSNLQTYFDGQVKFLDPELQEALTLGHDGLRRA